VAQRLREEGSGEEYGLRGGLAGRRRADRAEGVRGRRGTTGPPGAAKITRTSAAGSASV